MGIKTLLSAVSISFFKFFKEVKGELSFKTGCAGALARDRLSKFRPFPPTVFKHFFESFREGYGEDLLKKVLPIVLLVL